jgi:hypothetical protein
MHVNQLGDEIFISVYIPNKGVHTFTSFNQLTQWKKLGVIADTDKLNSASYMRSALSKQGNISKRILTFTVNKPYVKAKAKFFIQNDKGNDWLDITAQVTANAISDGSKTNYIFDHKSAFSNTAVIGDNKIFVAWEDHSYLVPTILINYSLNGGISWLKKPVFINYPGTNIQRYPKFLKGDSSLWMIFSQFGFKASDMSKPPLYATKVAVVNNRNSLTTINLPKISLEKIISKEEKLKLLKKRAKEFWDYRVERDYMKTYEYYEPMYRALFNKKAFLGTQGKIDFLDVKLGDVDMNGNIAVMDTDVTISISMFKTIEDVTADPSPPKKHRVKARWGWFYDNWYLLPETLFDRRRDF